MATPLQQGDMLQWFRIERVLGRGGFGITYLAVDENLDHLVAIKEYAPDQQVGRVADSSLEPINSDVQDGYQTGLRRFISEARTLVKFNHPSIVRILTVFEENNSAYLVMEYEEGEIFSDYVARNPAIQEARLKDIFLKVIDGLSQVHERGFLHRDIKPANLIIRKNGNPVLLDFGCARPALLPTDRTHTAFVTPGYSPLEQFHAVPGLEEGPWTDIYALCATLYFAITSQTPPNAASRIGAVAANLPDPLKPAMAVGREHYSRSFLAAIDWGLSSTASDRPQTLGVWRDALTAYLPVDGDATIVRPSRHSAARPGDNDRQRISNQQTVMSSDHGRSTGQPPPLDQRDLDQRPPPRPTSNKSAAAIGAVVGGAVLLAGAFFLWGPQAQRTGLSGNEQAQADAAGGSIQTAQQDRAADTLAPSADHRQLIAEIEQSIADGDLDQAQKALADAQSNGVPPAQLDALSGSLLQAERDRSSVAEAERALADQNPARAIELLAAIDSTSVFADRALQLQQLANDAERQDERRQGERAVAEYVEKIQLAIEQSDLLTAQQLVEQARALNIADPQLDDAADQVRRFSEFDQALSSAEQALQAGQLQASRELLEQARQTNITTDQLDRLAERLASAEQQTAQVRSQLATADTALSNSQWQAAAQAYQAALAIEPGNADAQSGLDRAAGVWLAQLQTQIDRGQLDSADDALKLGAEVFGESAELATLEQQLVSARDSRERQRLEQAAAEVQARAEAQAKADAAEAQARAEAQAKAEAAEAQARAEAQAKAEAAEAQARAAAQAKAEAAEKQRAEAAARRQQEKARAEALARAAEAERQQQARADAERERANNRKYTEQLAIVDRSLADGDLDAARQAIERASATGIRTAALDDAAAKYQQQLAAAQNKVPEITQQLMNDAELRFRQLARAVTNRNARAVGQLTEDSAEKLEFMEALFGKYKRIGVEIRDFKKSDTDNIVNALLELQDVILPDGSRATPSSSWRTHALTLELTEDGWGKIRW